MSIEEKKKPLEFTFIPDSTTGAVEVIGFEIVYDPEHMTTIGKMYSIMLTNNGQSINCPIELFTEVIDFLVEKGIIEGSLKEKNLVQTKVISTLPLPVIDGVGEEVPGQVVGQEGLAPVQPFTSFDDTDAEINDIVVADVDTAEGVSSIKVGDGEVVVEEIISRPVIRTRVGDSDDPQQAEKDAAVMRGDTESNFRRTE